MTDCQSVCYVLREDKDGINRLKGSVSVWTTSCNTNIYAEYIQLIPKILTLHGHVFQQHELAGIYNRCGVFF